MAWNYSCKSELWWLLFVYFPILLSCPSLMNWVTLNPSKKGNSSICFPKNPQKIMATVRKYARQALYYKYTLSLFYMLLLDYLCPGLEVWKATFTLIFNFAKLYSNLTCIFLCWYSSLLSSEILLPLTTSRYSFDLTEIKLFP